MLRLYNARIMPILNHRHFPRTSRIDTGTFGSFFQCLHFVGSQENFCRLQGILHLRGFFRLSPSESQ